MSGCQLSFFTIIPHFPPVHTCQLPAGGSLTAADVGDRIGKTVIRSNRPDLWHQKKLHEGGKIMKIKKVAKSAHGLCKCKKSC